MGKPSCSFYPWVLGPIYIPPATRFLEATEGMKGISSTKVREALRGGVGEEGLVGLVGEGIAGDVKGLWGK